MAFVSRIPAFRSFQYPSFRFLWVSTFLWAAASWMQRLAVSWLVLKATDSPFAVALVFVFNFAPTLVLGPLGGLILDRVNRKYMLIAIEAMAALTCVAIAVVAYSDTPDIGLIMFLAAVFGVSMAFNGPLIATLVYDIVEPRDALNANALRQIGQRSMGIAGALASGIMVDTVGVGTTVMAAAGVLALAIFNTSLMRYQRPVMSRLSQSLFKQLTEGFRYFTHSRSIGTLLLITMAAEGFGYGALSLLPVFADVDVLDVGSKGLGVMQGAVSLGGALAGVVWASFGRHHHRGLILSIAFIFYGISLGGFSQSDIYLLSLAALLIFGMAGGTYDMTIVVLLQENVPREMRGRVMGAWAFAIGIQPFGALALGGIAEVFDVRTAMLSAAGLLLVTSVGAALLVPYVRRLA